MMRLMYNSFQLFVRKRCALDSAQPNRPILDREIKCGAEPSCRRSNNPKRTNRCFDNDSVAAQITSKVTKLSDLT